MRIMIIDYIIYNIYYIYTYIIIYTYDNHNDIYIYINICI